MPKRYGFTQYANGKIIIRFDNGNEVYWFMRGATNLIRLVLHGNDSIDVGADGFADVINWLSNLDHVIQNWDMFRAHNANV